MQKTIFIVDDNVTNLAKAEEVLENHYLIITLTSAEKMFVVLEKVMPDLILLDIDMPDMDGLQAIKLLKESKKYSGIPVIFITGLTDADTEAYGIELGAVDLITKPFSEPVLLNRIRNHLGIDNLISEQTERLKQLQSTVIQTKDIIGRFLEDNERQIDPSTRVELVGLKNKLDAVSGVSNSPAVSERLINAFMRDAEKAVELLEAFSNNKNYEEDELKKYTTCVHGMKSALRNINEPELADVALKLEMAGRGKDIEIITEGLPDFIIHLKILVHKLNNQHNNNHI